VGEWVRLSASGKRLLLSKVSDVKIILHRPLEGTPKTATIRRTATGKWYVAISCDWEPTPLPAIGRQVGIDVGLSTFAACSDGETIANARSARRKKRGLARAQRRHQLAQDAHKALRASMTERVRLTHPELNAADLWQAVSQDVEERAAWQHRQMRRKVVARTHEWVGWKREDFAHQQPRRLVNACDLIAVEDLIVTSMVQDGRLAKSIHDAAWSQFAALIACKAAWADRRSMP
jgi:putative transposase